MQKHKNEHSIGRMAKALNVTRDGYYKYISRGKSATQQENEELVKEIMEIHRDNKKKVYGSPRMHKELKKYGKKCSRKRVAKLMSANGIVAINKKGWKRSGKNTCSQAKIAPNILNQNFVASKENTVWVSDITYVITEEGWLYVSAVLDLYSRKIVGLSMGNKINTDLIKRSLDQAICNRAPEEGLILHSDRGCQYTSSDYKAHLIKYGIKPSMSASGNCYDNAAMESFFSTLKKEHTNLFNFKTRKDAIVSIFEYVEVFYNRERLHSTIGYKSPVNFELEQQALLENPLESRVKTALPAVEAIIPICNV